MSSQSHRGNSDNTELKIKREKLPRERFDIAHLIVPFTYLPSHMKRRFGIKNDENRQEFITILKTELLKFYKD
jgi:hypothetical protein